MSEPREAGEQRLERLFAGRPEALRLFHVVREFVESLGPVAMAVAKTQVSFGMVRKFAWVWLPQLWTKKRAEQSVTVTFCLDRRVSDPRIAGAVEPRPGHWTHHVVIEGEADLDDALRGWLREAYDLGCLPGRRSARKAP